MILYYIICYLQLCHEYKTVSINPAILYLELSISHPYLAHIYGFTKHFQISVLFCLGGIAYVWGTSRYTLWVIFTHKLEANFQWELEWVIVKFMVGLFMVPNEGDTPCTDLNIFPSDCQCSISYLAKQGGYSTLFISCLMVQLDSSLGYFYFQICAVWHIRFYIWPHNYFHSGQLGDQEALFAHFLFWLSFYCILHIHFLGEMSFLGRSP